MEGSSKHLREKACQHAGLADAMALRQAQVLTISLTRPFVTKFPQSSFSSNWHCSDSLIGMPKSANCRQYRGIKALACGITRSR